MSSKKAAEAEYYGEDQGGRLARKARESPFMLVGE